MEEENGFLALENKLFEIIDLLETDLLKFVEPTNSVMQREKFFEALKKGEEYNPRFTYISKNPVFSHFTITPEYAKIMKELKEMEVEERGLGKLIRKKKNESLKRMEFIRSIGSNDLKKKSVSFYGKPGKELVAEAFEILAKAPKEKEKKEIPSERAAEIFNAEFRKRKIEWQALVDENISPNAVTLPGNNALKIRGDTLYSKEEIKRLIVHEIETHVYRHLNGKVQPFRLFIQGPGTDWLLSEEGLAVVNEEVFAGKSEERVYEYAGRVAAVDFAQRNSFYNTFKYMCEFFPAEKAYQLTQRAKRGLSNTVERGGLTKDFYYLAGGKLIRDFIARGGRLERLYYGKISAEDTFVLDEIPKLVKPEFLPKYGRAFSKYKKAILKTAGKPAGKQGKKRSLQAKIPRKKNAERSAKP